MYAASSPLTDDPFQPALELWTDVLSCPEPGRAIAGVGRRDAPYDAGLPTVFRAFLGFQGAQYGEASALSMVSLVPSIILGILVQRHLVRGLTLGAVRG